MKVALASFWFTSRMTDGHGPIVHPLAFVAHAQIDLPTLPFPVELRIGRSIGGGMEAAKEFERDSEYNPKRPPLMIITAEVLIVVLQLELVGGIVKDSGQVL